VIERKAEVAAMNAAVVLIAYDRPGLLGAKMMRGLDVPYAILFDPERAAYQRWGLGRTGPFGAWLLPALTWKYFKLLLRGERFLGFAPDMDQLGGDFMLDREHHVTFAHRMTNNGDRAETSVLLDELRRASHGPVNR
jgi:alkyl-hydroperoxide reductase/thiol specific antioxidant family protein